MTARFKIYDQALHLAPNDANGFNGRGLAYAHKGNYDRAVQDYDQRCGSIQIM